MGSSDGLRIRLGRRSDARVAGVAVFALISGLLVALPGGLVRPVPAFAVVPPTSVNLVSDVDVFPAGGSFSLTSTTDVTVTSSGYHTVIRDMQTGAVVTDCSTGTTCTQAGVSFSSGAPHAYQAFVYPTGATQGLPLVHSSDVTVARTPWSVAVSASSTSLAAGDSVAVTATANQSVGSTSGAYVMRVIDQTLGSTLATCSTGTTCAATYNYSGGAVHSIVGQVDDGNGGDVQATSSVLALTPSGWWISLVGTVTAGQLTLSGTISQTLTSSGFTARIRDITAATVVGTSSSGTAVGATVAVPTPAHVYVAEVIDGSGTVVTASGQVSSDQSIYQVSLTATGTVVTSTSSVTVTAQVNQTPGTGLSLVIVDVTTPASPQVVGNCSFATSCGPITITNNNPATPNRILVAYVAAPDGTNIQATSNVILVAQATWSVDLSVDRTLVRADQTFTLTAKANQDSNHYKILIYDRGATGTTSTLLQSCNVGAGEACVSPVISAGSAGWNWIDAPHRYTAYVATDGLATIAAVSTTVTVTRRPWTVLLTKVGDHTIRLRTDQGGANLAAAGYLVRLRTSTWSTYVFAAPGQTDYDFDVSGAGTTDPKDFFGYIAFDNGDPPKGDPGYAADSSGFTRPTGPIQAEEASRGGGNPASTSGTVLGTGEHVESATDLMLPGRLPVTLDRTYSSRNAAYLGAFGHGWSSPFSMQVVGLVADVATPGTPPVWGQPLAVVQENGAVAYFDFDAGGYTPRAGVDATLTRPGGLWVFKRHKDLLTFLFDASGALTEYDDRNGESAVVSRGATTLTVTARDGRAITLDLNPNGTIADATGPEGRVVTYNYDTSDNLASVADTRGKTWRYEYSTPSNHLMTSTRSPVQVTAGASVVYGYDSSGRVTSRTTPYNPVTGQTTPQTGTTTFAYTGTYPNFTNTMTQPGSPAVVTVFTYVNGYLTSTTVGAASTTNYAYDADGNLAQTQDATGVVTRSSYDTVGDRLTNTDAAGEVTTWSYNGLGEPLTETVSDGSGNHTTHLSYDTAGNLTGETMPLDASTTSSVTYHYGDALHHAGDVTSIDDARGDTTAYTYTAEGFVASSTAPDDNVAAGAKTTWTYDAYGDILTTVSPLGNCSGCTPATYTTTMTYYPHSSLVDTVAQPSNGSFAPTTTYAYDDDGHQTSMTDNASHVWATSYWLDGTQHATSDPLSHGTSVDLDAAGRTQKSTAADGGVTTTTYDSHGWVSTDLPPEGNKAGRTQAEKDARTISYSYDAAGRQTASTVPDPNSSTPLATTTTYDYAGRPSVTMNPNGEFTTTTYGPGSLPATVTDGNGKVTSYVYDYAQRLTQEVDPSNGTAAPTTTYTYYPTGDVKTVAVKKDATTNLVTSYTYDAVGRVETMVAPNGNCGGCTPANFTTTALYDLNGEQTMLTDPLGHFTSWAYYPSGQIKSATNPKSTVTNYAYNSTGRLAQVAVPGSTSGTSVTKYTYDNAGRLNQVEVPLSTVATPVKYTYGYDASNRPTTLTNPLSKTTTTSYDLDGNPKTYVTARGGTAGTITYTVDALERQTNAAYGDGSHAVAYTYDRASRRASMTDAVTGTLVYAYDGDGRVTSIKRGTSNPWAYAYYDDGSLKTSTRPDNTVETYSYDQAGRRTQVITPVGTSTYTWDADSNLASTAYPNGTVEAQTWDQADNLASDITTKAGATLVSMVVNTRDQTNNPTKITMTRGASSEYRTFTYDPVDRVKTVCFNIAQTSCDQTAASQWWSYDLDGDRTREKNGTGTGTTTTYTYNSADQPLTSKVGTAAQTSFTEDADGNVTADGAGNTYVYDLNNQIKTATLSGTAWTWTRDGDGNLITQVSGATTNTSTWDVNQPVPQLAGYVTGSTNRVYRYDPIGRPATVTQAAVNESYAHDAVGGPTDLLSSAGVIVRSFDFAPFGLPRTAVGQPGTPSGPLSDPGFQGLPTLHTASLSGTPTRALDSVTGRFTGTDPVFMSSGTAWDTPYTYARSSPINNTDPTGMCVNDTGTVVCGVDTAPPAAADGPTGDKVTDILTGVIGFEDTLSGGLSRQLRQSIGLGGAIDEHNSAYRVGAITGDVTNVALIVVGLPTAVESLAGLIEALPQVADRIGPRLVAARTSIGTAIDSQAAALRNAAVRVAASSDAGYINFGAKAGGAAEAGASDWPKLSGMLRDAARGKGDFTIGSATQEQAEAMGIGWVGDGATLSKSGNAWLSADGVRAYRPMSFKDGAGVWRANLETRVPGQVSRGPIANAHIDILDPP